MDNDENSTIRSAVIILTALEFGTSGSSVIQLMENADELELKDAF